MNGLSADQEEVSRIGGIAAIREALRQSLDAERSFSLELLKELIVKVQWSTIVTDLRRSSRCRLGNPLDQVLYHRNSESAAWIKSRLSRIEGQKCANIVTVRATVF